VIARKILSSLFFNQGSTKERRTMSKTMKCKCTHCSKKLTVTKLEPMHCPNCGQWNTLRRIG
jgi:predicted RNA-binding Zn-ribbon protein involved in translation (DUF1610 family)